MSSADQSHIACADEQVEPHQTEDEHVYLLTYNRAPEKFRVALVEGSELEGVRDSLRDHGFAYVWESAKVFVHPWQYEDVLENLQAEEIMLKNVHVIVSASLEFLVQAVWAACLQSCGWQAL